MTRYLYWILIVLVIATLLLTACGPEEAEEARGITELSPLAAEVEAAEEIPAEIIIIIMTPTPGAETPAPEAVMVEAPAEEAEPSAPEAETAATEAEAPESGESAPAEEAGTAEDIGEAQAEATPPEVAKQAEVETPTPETEALETGEEAPEAEVTGTPAAQGEATAETDKPSEAQTPTATATVAPLSQEELVSRGAELYTLNCAACHQPDGQGVEQVYPPLVDNPFITSEDPTAAIEVVLTGRGGMPNFRDDLSSQEIAAILSYVRNAWSNDTSVVQPAQVNQVRENLAEETEVTDKEN